MWLQMGLFFPISNNKNNREISSNLILSKVYRGAVEFRRAEVLSMERMERIGGTLDALDGSKSTKNLRPLSALKYLGMNRGNMFF